MSKREKKLLYAMAAIIVLAGAFLLYDRLPSKNGSQKTTQAASLKEVKTQVEEIEKKMKASALPEGDMYILNAAARPWNASGFYDGSMLFGKKTKEKGAPSYTGYIELGSEKLAILNGVEYMAGDLLDNGRYRVVSIEPERVTLAGTQGQGELVLPYEDPDGAGR